MKLKPFFKLLITLILTFTVTMMTCFVAFVTTMGGSFLGYEFATVEQQTPYINVLLMGLDKDKTRTDVMILAQLNIVDGELNMLQIPRDTYMPGRGRLDKKLNSGYGIAKETTVLKEVSELLGIHIDKYVTIDIDGFRDLIDTIGGVDFYVPQDMHYEDQYQDLYIHLNKGQQHLNGAKAEQLVRFRHYAMGDLDRMKVQSDFIQATIDEIFQLKNVTKISDMVEDFSKTVKTNFTLNEMLTYAPYVFEIDRSKFGTYQMPCELYDENGGSYVKPIEADIEKMIKEHFTPSVTETRTTEELKGSIEGDGVAIKVGNTKAEKSFFNMFTSIDIVDASGGRADVNAIKKKFKTYGYNVMSVTAAPEASYTTTVVVSNSEDSTAAEVAQAMGLKEYILNPVKDSGSDITIILGN